MIIITNPGTMDLNGLRLFGASSKRQSNEKIGFFGSGVKYAISWMLRNEIDFQLWINGEPIDITTQDIEMRGTSYKEILIGGERTSITTEMGPKWKAWMSIRELYSNAIDEGGEMIISDNYSDFIGENRTTFVITDEERYREVIENQDFYFSRGREIIYEDDRLIIYQRHKMGAGFYINGVLVSESQVTEEGYGYQLKINRYLINEERSISDMSVAKSMTAGALMRVEDKYIIDKILLAVSTCDTSFGFESSILNLYQRMSCVNVGACDAPIACEDGTKYDHVSSLDHPEKSSVSDPWMNWRFTIGIFEMEEAKGSDKVSMVSSVLVNNFKLRRFSSEKWKPISNDAAMKDIEASYVQLRELVPELESLMPSKCPFRIGSCYDSKIVMQNWNGDHWISIISAISESNSKLMSLMFAYLMVETGSSGEKIAALMIRDRINQKVNRTNPDAK